MLPDPFVSDEVDGRNGHAEVLGDRRVQLAGTRPAADGAHVGFSELRSEDLLAAAAVPVTIDVRLVLELCRPPQVGQAVILLVAVVVGSFGARERRRATEGA